MARLTKSLHGCYYWPLLLLFISFLIQVISSSNATHKACRHDQSSALLQFRSSFSIYEPIPRPRLLLYSKPFDNHSKLWSWKPNTDCCSWDGVTCDEFGFVIGLDVSLSGLYGNSIDSNSSLFKLSHLKKLNIAYNEFSPSTMPTAFVHLQSLTHLNLSRSNFSGQVPMEISQLINLVSLDFSDSSSLRIPDLGTLLRNMSSLRELRLDGLNLSMSGWEQLFSSPQLNSLQVLSLSGCGLSGPITMNSSSMSNLSSLSVLVLSGNGITHFPKEMFNLPNLRVLELVANILHTGSLPEFQNSSSLEELILTFTRFSGALPPSVGNLKRLTKLDLTLCGFSGEFPSNSFTNLSNLVWLSLVRNNFSGSLPSIKASSRTITRLDLSFNKFTGPIHDSYVDGLPNLAILDLSNNLLTGSVPSSLFYKLPSLWSLDLGDNQLSGELEEFERPSSSQLEGIVLCGNLLEGRIIRSFFELPTLKTLRLCSNRFQGVLDQQMFIGRNNLTNIDFSYNRMLSIDPIDAAFTIPNLSIFDFSSCNLTRFPTFLKHQKTLGVLDLGNNQLTGKVPSWIWNKARFLNISSNLLDGFERPIPDFSSSNLWNLDLRSNMFDGPIPDLPTTLGHLTLSNNYFTQLPGSICNSSSLRVLDLSNNRIIGTIPPCLGKLVNLQVIDLGKNKFSGGFGQEFNKACSLSILNMNGNQLEGLLPRSLANCSGLKILDLGHNRINDTYPFWLESLLRLEVLVLQSNNFHGTISGSRDSPSTNISFPSLHIIDLSYNSFTGHLPLKYFKSSRAMTTPNEDDGKYESALSSTNRQYFYYGYSLILGNKGQQLSYFYEILYILSAVDLSSNMFEGEIPELIGDFKSLVVLNLSYNNLAGKMPSALGNLRKLQSLDLSNNNLSGEIPPELTSLTFLSMLNVSRNKLVGIIPSAFQFSTFNSSSFEGNLGLCGFPLNIKCNRHGNKGPPPFSSSEKPHDVAIFDWKFALAGLGAGFVIGLVIEHFILMRNMYYLAKILSIQRYFCGDKSIKFHIK